MAPRNLQGGGDVCQCSPSTVLYGQSFLAVIGDELLGKIVEDGRACNHPRWEFERQFSAIFVNVDYVRFDNYWAFPRGYRKLEAFDVHGRSILCDGNYGSAGHLSVWRYLVHMGGLSQAIL